MQIANEGIERRSLDLMLDTLGGHHRFAETDHDERFIGTFSP